MKNLPSGHKTDPKRDKKTVFWFKIYIFVFVFYNTNEKKYVILQP